jgi:addiction module RelE/StbE family toxin
MAVEWTRTALRNLDDIAGYIAKDNPPRAHTFVAELKEKTTKLAFFPNLGKVGRLANTRELVLHKNYIAIYRVVGDEVQILRIHHAAKDL